MAKVPLPFGAIGRGLLQQGPRPSDANLLMAAADMHAQGAFAEPKPRSPQGIERPRVPARGPRKLKMVK